MRYEEVDEEKEFLEMGAKNILIIHYEHLIVNKMLIGRSQDKADVDMLKKIKKYRKDK